MEKEVKDFILKALEDAYSYARDEYSRALIQHSRMDDDSDAAPVARYKKRMQTAKQALAYFGVYH